MSHAIQRLIAASDDLQLAGVWAREPETAGEGGTAAASSDLGAVVAAGDVLVDFTLPAASRQVFAAVRDARKPLVCGVSGLDAELLALLRGVAAEAPVVYDRNMSRGIAVLQDLVRRATSVLGPDFRVAIHETHHVHKLDAPSGTALQLGEAVAGARGQRFADVASMDAPDDDQRPEAVRFFVQREGEVPGDHEVEFASPTEMLRLSHSVTSREVFAAGAISAARWVSGRRPGLYSMQDVLDLAPAN